MKKSTNNPAGPQAGRHATGEGACLVRLRAALPGASPSGRRVIGYVLGHPEQSAALSIEELAQRCKTSASSLTRLCTSLGYEGYREFQRDLVAAGVAAASTPLEHFAPGETPGNIIAQVFECNRRSLSDTQRVLETKVVSQVARRIQRARKTVFMGIGESAAVAETAAQRLACLGLTSIALADPYSQVFVSGNAGKGDVVIGISHTGQTALIVEALTTARSRGAYAVAITNYPESPLATACDAVLQTAFEEHRISAAVSSSRIAQSCVIDCLYFLLANSMSDKAAKLSEEAEKRVERMIRVPGRRRKKW